MGRMGHVSTRAALIYQHRTVERDRAIAEALDAMLRAGGVSASLGTFWARGRRLDDVRLSEQRIKVALTRADAVERVTRIERA